MPPKIPHDRDDAEQTTKRSRKSVERLSSSELQAKQYSPLAGLETKAENSPESGAEVCAASMPPARGECTFFTTELTPT